MAPTGVQGIGSMPRVLAGLESLLLGSRGGLWDQCKRNLAAYSPIVQFGSLRGTSCVCLALSFQTYFGGSLLSSIALPKHP